MDNDKIRTLPPNYKLTNKSSFRASTSSRSRGSGYSIFLALAHLSGRIIIFINNFG